MDKKRILDGLKRPKGIFLASIYVLTVIFIACALCAVLLLDYEGNALSIIAYASFAFAALFLSYSVYTIVIYSKNVKTMVKRLILKNKFTARLSSDFGYRTIAFSILSFTISVSFSIFYGVIAILGRSIWYGALAAYYIIMAFMRGGIVLYHGRHVGEENKDELLEIIKFKSTGSILTVTVLALSAAIIETIINDNSFKYDGLMIYCVAAFAFYKIITSAINVFRARKHDDYTVQAVRNVNFADALVSIFALQTALLKTFSPAGYSGVLFNSLTGGAICVIILALGIFMTVKGIKTQKLMENKLNEGK